ADFSYIDASSKFGHGRFKMTREKHKLSGRLKQTSLKACFFVYLLHNQEQSRHMFSMINRARYCTQNPITVPRKQAFENIS
ncbi:unnamed protein product, partial [Musa acuminata var. zebrina]